MSLIVLCFLGETLSVLAGSVPCPPLRHTAPRRFVSFPLLAVSCRCACLSHPRLQTTFTAQSGDITSSPLSLHFLRNYFFGLYGDISLIALAQSGALSLCNHLDGVPTLFLSNWEFLCKTLSATGFHSTFIDWVRIIYRNPRSRVRVNGYCSGFFDLERAVRQGDCLSPLLFAINIESFAASIRMRK